MALEAPMIQLQGIKKRFGTVLANDGIDLEVKKGEVHAIFGENGAGKSTLMKILYGLIKPDEGEIYIEGQKVVFHSPADALEFGVGMVHQTFKLVPTLSVLDNVALPLKISGLKGYVKEVNEIIDKICQEHDLRIDKKALVKDLGAHEQQLVEIIKLLCLEQKVLIFDEPTSVLVGEQILKLLEMFRNWAEEGYAVIFISHKVDEVLSATDRITVLRNGKKVDCVETKKASRDELARMLAGEDFESVRSTKRFIEGREKTLSVENLTAYDAVKKLNLLNDLSFSVSKGEIYGIAGVMGNGQDHLVEIITGTHPEEKKIEKGKILIDEMNVTGMRADQLSRNGIDIAYIPPKPKEVGVTQDWSLKRNLLLRSWPKYGNFMVNWNKLNSQADELIADYNIITHSKEAKVATLSGGNQTKVILAREINRHCPLMVIYDPCPGLDIKAIELFKQMLLDCKNETAILLIASELTLLTSICDNLGVIFEGTIYQYEGDYDIEKIASMMIGGRAS